MKLVRSRSAAVLALALSVVTVTGLSTAGAALPASRDARGLSAVPHVAKPHATGHVAHTYTVNTTTDDYLSGSAPAHTCQDNLNHAKCSLRAAIAAANNDFDDQPNSWDVIDVPAGTYTLSSAVDSSALYLDEEGDLTINGAGPTKTVINASSFDNEILDIDDAIDSLAVNGVGFTGGYSFYGGAVYFYGEGGASFTNCAFTSNEATRYGGAIYIDADTQLTVTDSTFSENTADFGGGAIYDDDFGTLTLSRDTFSHNEEIDDNVDYGGGAVYSDAGTSVTNSTFGNNTAGGSGAGIYADTNATVTSSLFSGNDANYYGGAVFSSGDLIFNNNSLKGDDAEDGGGIYTEEQAEVAGSQFASDGAEDGGDIYNEESVVTVANSTLSKGSASVSGGSLYNYEGTFALSADTITGARGLGTDYGGGGLYSYEGVNTLSNVTIIDCTAPGGNAGGGGIFSSDSSVSMSGGTLSHDSTGEGGGAVYAYDGTTSIQDASISDDSAPWGGGVLTYGESSNLNISDSTVSGNDSSSLWGGGISVYYGGSVTITNSSLIDNRADGTEGYGGALALYEESGYEPEGSLINDTIAGNQGTYGGGIYTYESYLSISSSTVADNSTTSGSAAGYGGGMYNNTSVFMSTDTIWSGNGGDQCAGSDISYSGGFNLDADNSCGLDGAGDIVSHAATLGPLQNNGGPTKTVAPLSGSLAISDGGPSCPLTDQRGVSVPSGETCDIGAVFVAGSVASVSLTKASIVLGHENTETFKVTVSTKAAGVKPTGIVDVLAGTKVVCAVTVVAGKATCSLAPSKLKKGSYKISVKYLGSGAVASSVSSNKSLKVT